MVDPKDRVAQGDPDTVVLLAHGALVGLYIRGVTSTEHIMLGIREDAEGQPVSCAVTNVVHIDTSRTWQSNPRRRLYRDDVIGPPSNGDEA